MRVSHILLLVLFLFPTFQISAQQKLQKRANRLYKNEQFAAAADLFEQIPTDKINLSTKTKLAYCYRMNNKIDAAEKLYAEIVQEERAKADTYFHYAEMLMSNGKYSDAKFWFLKYIGRKPGNEQGIAMVRACETVKMIQPFFKDIQVTEFPFNSDADDSSPVFWSNGIVFTSDRKAGLNLLNMKSGWTGRDFLRIFYTEKTDSSYTEPKPLSSKLTEPNKNSSNASFSADGQTVFFTKNNNLTSRKKTYNLQLFQGEYKGGERWKKVEKMSFCSPEYNYMHPAISPDGKWLYYASDKPGGSGGLDIWVSQKKGDKWGKPQNLGEQINTTAHEGFPFMDTEGRLFFCSKGHAGYGGFDIFMTQQDEEGMWQNPINLGRPINSSMDDISIFIAKDQRSGAFTSARKGGDDDIFLFEIQIKSFSMEMGLRR